jgi:hypothetical protein
MKALLILASVIFCTHFACAETLLSCHHNNPKPDSPIQGSTLVIEKLTGGALKGIMYPHCRVCTIVPTYIDFDGQLYDGSKLIITGKTHKLTVAIEAMLPTRTHSAMFLELSSNVSTDFVCEQQ